METLSRLREGSGLGGGLGHGDLTVRPWRLSGRRLKCSEGKRKGLGLRLEKLKYLDVSFISLQSKELVLVFVF